MANFKNYPIKAFSTDQKFLADDPNQVVRVTGQSMLDANIEDMKKSGKVVNSIDTLTEAIAGDYLSGIYLLVGGGTVTLDGDQAIYRVSDAGSGGIVMASGNELVLLFVANTPANIITPIDSVANIAGFVGSLDDQQISLKGWHPDSDVGGGTLYWDSAALKSTHNGGTIFSPTVPWTTTTADYLNAVGETDGAGTGVWVRTGFMVTPQLFGAVANGVTADDSPINAAVRWLVSIGGGELFYPTGIYAVERGVRLDAFNIETNTYGVDRVQRVVHRGEDKNSTIILCNKFYACGFTSFPEPNIAQPAFGGETDFLGEKVQILNMTIDCNYGVIVDGGAAYGSNYATYGGAFPNGSGAPSIHAADNYQYPIYAFRFHDLLVDGCIIKQSWYNGIEIYRTFNYEIKNNEILKCGDKANYLGFYSGVQLDNGSSEGEIHHNSFDQCGNNILSNGGPIDTNDRAVEKVHIYNNVFNAPAENHHISGFDWLEKWRIHDNEFYDAPREVLRITFDNPGGSAKLERHASDFQFYNNKVYEFNLINSSGRPAVRFNGHNISAFNNEIYQTDATVTNNTYGFLFSEVGITIPSGQYQYAQVSGNTLVGYFAGSASTVSMCNMSIDNARVFDNQFESLGAVCVLAARLDGDNSDFYDNKIKGSFSNVSGTRPFIYVTGTSLNAKDNRFSSLMELKTTSGETALTGTNTVDFNGFGVVNYDTRTNFSTGLNSFVADIPGKYRFTALSVFTNVGTAATPVTCTSSIELNTTTGFGITSGWNPGRLDLTSTAVIDMAAGNTVRLRMTCASSHTIESNTYLRAEYVGPL